MFTYDNLARHPKFAPRLIGMRLFDFNQLYRTLESNYPSYLVKRDELSRREPRRRKPGAGRKYRLDLRNRLLLTLLWAQVRPTHYILGQIFHLHRCSVEKILWEVCAGLACIPTFPLDALPTGQRGALRSMDVLLDFYPEIRELRELNTKGGKM